MIHEVHARARGMRFEVYKGRGRHPYRWRARRQNGRIVADSAEGYTRERSAKRAVAQFLQGVTVLLESTKD